MVLDPHLFSGSRHYYTGKKAALLRVIFSKVQTGVMYQYQRLCSNSARCGDLILKKITLPKFPSTIFVGFQDIAAKGGGGRATKK